LCWIGGVLASAGYFLKRALERVWRLHPEAYGGKPSAGEAADLPTAALRVRRSLLTAGALLIAVGVVFIAM
jgi:hypothetical protein